MLQEANLKSVTDMDNTEDFIVYLKKGLGYIADKEDFIQVLYYLQRDCSCIYSKLALNGVS